MDIKFDKRNYRKHNDKNKELINKSLRECGAGRSIVIDNEDNIIAGNGLYEQAKKLGIHGKDLSKADCSVNVYCYIKAQETGLPIKAICSIGDTEVNVNGNLIKFADIVEEARAFINKKGGFEKLAEWGLDG